MAKDVFKCGGGKDYQTRTGLQTWSRKFLSTAEARIQTRTGLQTWSRTFLRTEGVSYKTRTTLKNYRIF